jgi:type IX secretion system PorP/SprF family membrane protein
MLTNINMPYMKQLKIILTLLIILMKIDLSAQQEPMYSQYFFNNSVINPAQAGAAGSNQAGILVRNQWVGIDGAPKTLTAYVNLRLPGQLGLAAGIYQDRIGPEVNTHFQTDLAYHARLSQEWYLSGGIRFTATYMRVGLTEVPNVDPRNPFFTMDVASGLKLNTGVGFLAYNSRTFFGISMPKAFKTQISVSEPGVATYEKNEVRTLFAYGGSSFQLSQDVTLTPSALIRVSTMPPQLDLNAVCGFKNAIDFGLLFRSNLTELDNWFNSTGILIGISYWENWYLGYIYEIPVSSLRSASMQTHEISLRFFWGIHKFKLIKSPRYFL